MSDQLLTFLGMAGITVMVKEVRGTGATANPEYLQKRWKALCATTGIADMFEAGGGITRDVFNNLIQDLERWQTFTRSRAGLRRDLLRLALRDTPDDTPELIKKALEQVRMVLTGFGLNL